MVRTKAASDSSLTEIQQRTVEALKQAGKHGLTPTELGEVLWPEKRFVNRQAFALPAGKVLKPLVEAGEVQEKWVQSDRWMERKQEYRRTSRRRFFHKSIKLPNSKVIDVRDLH